MNFLAIYKQIETLEAYKKKVEIGDVPLTCDDKEIITNLTYSLRNWSYHSLNNLSSDKVNDYIKNNIKNNLEKSLTGNTSINKLVSEVKNTDTVITPTNTTYMNSNYDSAHKVDYTPTTNTTTYVNTYTEIATTISPKPRRSKRATKKPSRLGFN